MHAIDHHRDWRVEGVVVRTRRADAADVDVRAIGAAAIPVDDDVWRVAVQVRQVANAGLLKLRGDGGDRNRYLLSRFLNLPRRDDDFLEHGPAVLTGPAILSMGAHGKNGRAKQQRPHNHRSHVISPQKMEMT
ncbi:MAG: hypothetical protein F4Z84_17885 [Gammaproteobacteria bacterium]|nr:hypothetical protein [Gammaproteobacteria bacterium]